MKTQLLALCAFTCLLGACSHPAPEAAKTDGWEQEATGVWRVSVGKPEPVNLLSELHVSPKLDALREVGETELPISPADVRFEVVDGKTYLRFPLEKDEKILYERICFLLG